MSKVEFVCSFCNKVCASSRGLKLHYSKSHSDRVNTLQCTYCQDIFCTSTSLRMHLLNCTAKAASEKEERLKQQHEIEHWKQAYEECQQELQQVQRDKQVYETIVKSMNTVNINSINTINNNSIHLQSDCSTKEISVDYLQECFEKVKRLGVICNASEMAAKMFSTDLQYRITKTDSSRNVIQWNDGDEKRKVKDPQGKILAKKTITATSGQMRDLNGEYNALIDEYHECNDVERVKIYADAIKFTYMASTNNEEVISEFGKKIGKMGFVNPSLLPPQQTNSLMDKCQPMVKEMVACMMKSPQMLLAPPEHLGSHLSVHLTKYRKVYSFERDGENGDDNKFQVIYRCNGVDITRSWFYKCFREALRQCWDQFEELMRPLIDLTNLAHYYRMSSADIDADELTGKMREHLTSLKHIHNTEDHDNNNDYFAMLLKSI